MILGGKNLLESNKVNCLSRLHNYCITDRVFRLIDMKRIILLICICTLPMNCFSQNWNALMKNSKSVNLYGVNIELFNSRPEVNFFFGELREYFISKGRDCYMNVEQTKDYPVPGMIDVKATFSFRINIQRNGVYNYQFNDVVISVSNPSTHEEYRFNFGYIECGTRPGNLKAKFNQLIGL